MSDIRSGAVLMADIAAATELRARIGDRAADAQIDPLIQRFTQIVESHGGRVLKSDGDDILAVFDGPALPLVQAAAAAVDCQRAARAAARSLYAGIHAGEIEFREVLGRPDVAGMPVNMAARLHKLVPNLPGHIFLAAESLPALSAALRERVRPYGVRPIKGVGVMEVCTLDWDEADTVMPTRFADSAASPRASTALTLRHGDHALRVTAEDPPLLIGRDRNSDLRVQDDEQRVSSRHLRIQCRNGAWILHDISRNGTWLRFDGSRNEVNLLGEELKLIGSGRLCLGRSLAEDSAGLFTLRFELKASGR